MTVTKEKRKVFGVGINDIKEPSKSPYYQRWYSMLRRCYSKLTVAYAPTYSGCYVYQDWLKISNFKSWMLQQDWEGKQLDKDILVIGNKEYHPDKCVFVDSCINSLVLVSGNNRYADGVHENRGRLLVGIHDPFLKRKVNLGYYPYDQEILAHDRWKAEKRSFIERYAKDGIICDNVYNALIKRYS